MSSQLYQLIVLVVIWNSATLGVFAGEAALATPSSPAAAAVPATANVVPAQDPAPPAPVPAPVSTGPIAPNPAGISAPGLSGTVTKHENPDGTIITVSRFNGNIPQSVIPSFPNMWGSHPMFQPNQYLGYPGWGIRQKREESSEEDDDDDNKKKRPRRI